MLRRIRFPALLLAGLVLGRAAIVPEAPADPRIAGFRFPESEATLTRWVTEMTRGVSPEVKDAAAARIYLHGWGLWTALTAETGQTYDGQRLRVFETWRTPDDLALATSERSEGGALAAPGSPVAEQTRDDSAPRAPNVNALARAATQRAALRPLGQLRRSELEEEFDPALVETPMDRVAGFVKYDPVAAGHIVQQELMKLSTLDILLQGGAQQIPPFPAASLVVKPVFQVIHARDLVDGRYHQMKAWPGPPHVAQAWGPAQWPGAVWIDRYGGGAGTGAIDERPAADGSTRAAENTYPLSALIHYRLNAADAAAQNLAKPGSNTSAGDIAILVAMHVSTREIARWTWQTFWWSPSPADPHAPSSAAIAAQRPAELRGAPRHYAMSLAYTMLAPDQPYVGGENASPAVYAYNPWIEARFAPADLPDSRTGLDPAGRPAANNFGVQTNCMSCHVQANHNPLRLATAPRFAGARYIDLGAAEFVGTLQVDFLWSIARHAK